MRDVLSKELIAISMVAMLVIPMMSAPSALTPVYSRGVVRSPTVCRVPGIMIDDLQMAILVTRCPVGPGGTEGESK